MVALGDTLMGMDRARLKAALKKIGVALGGGRIARATARPHLQPTVFVPTRRGGDLHWEDVVARKV